MSEYPGEDQICKTIDLLMYMVIDIGCIQKLVVQVVFHTHWGDGMEMNSSLSLRCLATFPGLILPLLHLTFDTMQPLLQLVIGSSIVMEPCD